MVPAQQNKALVQLDDRRALTAAQFHQLAEVPAEAEWFANIANPGTRRVYRDSIRDFTAFVGLADRV